MISLFPPPRYHAILFVFVFFSGRDDLDRKLQAQRTAEILANATNPIVMLSYITNRHGSRDYTTIVEKGNVKVSKKKHMNHNYEITLWSLLITSHTTRISMTLTRNDSVSTFSIVA